MSEISQTRKPKDSRFEQQRLPAWQPILTAGTVMPTFFVIGIVFIPLGVFLLFVSNGTQEIVIDYTDCESATIASRSNGENGTLCKDIVKAGSTGDCLCQIPFEVTKSFPGTVFIYYALTSFYQNHRRYLNSYDDEQLRGVKEAVDYTNPAKVKLSSDCEPFRYVNNDKEQGIYFPCGAIANSFFTDEISILRDGSEVALTSEGIAWDTDLKYKFKNPSWWNEAKQNPTHPAWSTFKKPKDWKKELWELEDGLQNKDLVVWMRTAALPNFRKLYRVVNDSRGISKGNYTLNIKYAFPVAGFKGTKSVVIATTNIIGGKNPFIGIAYAVVGAVCLLLAAVFMVIHLNSETRNLQSVTPNTADRVETTHALPSGDAANLSKGNDSLDRKHGEHGYKKKSN